MFSLSDAESARGSLTAALRESSRALAVFDASGRLSSSSEGYPRALAPLGPAELADADYDRVLEQVLRSSIPRAGDGPTPSPAFERELDVDLALTDGRTIRWSQHRLPSGGLFVLLLDRTEDERRLQELQDALREARALHRAAVALLRSLSRELCSQLNAVLGFVQLMLRERKEPLSERNQARAREATRGGKGLIRLLMAANEFARSGLDQLRQPIDSVDALDLVERVRAALAPLALRVGVTLHAESYHSASLPSVRAARGHLIQILMNLGSNAIEHNRPNGTVIFKLSVPRAGIVRINVVDTGPGIEREHHAHLFQPFYRAARTAGEGAGLGLAIAERLAEAIGGRIGFESAVGVGSEFWVDLPSEAR